MDTWWTSAARVLLLASPALLGALASRLGLFPDRPAAINTLNKYALYLGFPALVAHSLAQPGAPAPEGWGFWLLWPLTLAVVLVGLRVVAPGGLAGSMALVTCFGNVAYLGLPCVLALYGGGVASAAALAVSIHVIAAVTLGPSLLAAWGGRDRPPWRAVVGRVVRLPLFWAPGLGLALRAGPELVGEPVRAVLAPMAASAAPVALFLLGLYLYEQRRQLWRWDGALVAHLAARQLVAPLVALGLALGMIRMGWLTPELGRVHVMLASMPVAITTFSMAHDAQVGQQAVASAIVWSSVLALVWLPLWAWAASWMGG